MSSLLDKTRMLNRILQNQAQSQ
ncbi:hypothetical protein CFSAN001628_022227 [Clostridium botulinum CFSAN001628]|nr:hypothetical protein CFSAN001628_022227 [Clostridium botulinum CFSAN001628]